MGELVEWPRESRARLGGPVPARELDGTGANQSWGQPTLMLFCKRQVTHRRMAKGQMTAIPSGPGLGACGGDTAQEAFGTDFWQLWHLGVQISRHMSSSSMERRGAGI